MPAERMHLRYAEVLQQAAQVYPLVQQPVRRAALMAAEIQYQLARQLRYRRALLHPVASPAVRQPLLIHALPVLPALRPPVHREQHLLRAPQVLLLPVRQVLPLPAQRRVLHHPVRPLLIAVRIHAAPLRIRAVAPAVAVHTEAVAPAAVRMAAVPIAALLHEEVIREADTPAAVPAVAVSPEGEQEVAPAVAEVVPADKKKGGC